MTAPRKSRRATPEKRAAPRPRGRSLSVRDLMKSLERERPRGVYALCGPEVFVKGRTLEAMKKALLGDGAPGAGARYAVDSFRLGEQETGEILSAASQAGLFGGERLILVDGIERFTRLGSADRDAWFQTIAAIPANPVVLVSEQTSRELARRAKTLAEILGAVTVVDFWHLSADQACAWLRKYGKEERGLEITQPAAEQMIRHLGMDLLSLSAEIDKIALMRGTGRIDMDDLRELARRGILGSSWECVDQILAGDLRPAMESLRAVRREESSFAFAWKLNQAVARSLADESGPSGARRAYALPAGERAHGAIGGRNAARKKVLGRLLWGCYEWERDLKTGRWAGTHDYSALEALVLAHMHRLHGPGRDRSSGRPEQDAGRRIHP